MTLLTLILIAAACCVVFYCVMWAYVGIKYNWMVDDFTDER